MNNFEHNLENLSNSLQILSFLILIKDFNNTDLMQYLNHQDKLLDKIIEQNEQIIQQNQYLIDLLGKGSQNGN